MRIRTLLSKLRAFDDGNNRLRVYVDVGGTAGPYLEVDRVVYYENGVHGEPSLILLANPADTAEIQKQFMLSSIEPAIESAKRALGILINLQNPDQQKIQLLRPAERKSIERKKLLRLLRDEEKDEDNKD